MKKVVSAAVIALLIALSYVAGRQRTAGHATASNSSRRVLYWVDPMHPDYRSDHPGIAPDCGMQLEPVYAETVASASNRSKPCARKSARASSRARRSGRRWPRLIPS